MRSEERHQQRLTIVLGTHDRAEHHRRATELLARARRAGLSGATVIRGDLDAPEPAQSRAGGTVATILIVDDAARLARFVADSVDLIGDASRLDDVLAFRA